MCVRKAVAQNITTEHKMIVEHQLLSEMKRLVYAFNMEYFFIY